MDKKDDGKGNMTEKLDQLYTQLTTRENRKRDDGRAPRETFYRALIRIEKKDIRIRKIVAK